MDPTEPSYCRSGATFIRVTAEYEDGHKVIRERTRSANKYIISIPGEVKPQELAGFGDNVPLEVQQATGIRPLQIGDVELFLNLSEQLDGPFLGSKSVSAPARAKVLGKLAGTEEIDFAGKTLGTDLYRRGQDEKRLTGEVADLEEDIKEFDYLPGMAKKIGRIEKIAEQIKANHVRREKLINLNEQAAQIQKKIADTQTVLCKWRNIDQAESCLSAALEKSRLAAAIGALKDRLQGILGNIYYLKLKLVKWRNLPQVEKMLPVITSNQSRKERLVSFTNRYRTQKDGIQASREIIALYAFLPIAEERFRNAREKAARLSRLRPLRTSYVAGQEMIQRSRETLNKLESLDTVEALLREIDSKKLRRETLSNLSIAWVNKNKALAETKKLMERLVGVDEAGEIVAKTAEKQKRWKEFLFVAYSFGTVNGCIKGYSEKLVLWENRVAELEGAYRDELDAIGICPMCGALKNEMRIKEAV